MLSVIPETSVAVSGLVQVMQDENGQRKKGQSLLNKKEGRSLQEYSAGFLLIIAIDLDVCSSSM